MQNNGQVMKVTSDKQKYQKVQISKLAQIYNSLVTS